jgi:serine/threonine-protein kinase HipA
MIYFSDQKVAEILFLEDTDEFKLIYEPNWIRDGFPISPCLGFKSHFKSIDIKRFLEGLFPEGNALEELLELFRLTQKSTYRITRLIGKDTTGALRFIDENDIDKMSKTTFRKLEEEELALRLDKRATEGLGLWDGSIRLSVAGVQDKLPVMIKENGEMGFGEGDFASTHILKFQKLSEKIPHLVLNEYFCMKLAKLIKINVAEVDYILVRNHPVLKVTRFDRKQSESKVERLHIVDACQALGLPTSYKYERNLGSGRDVEMVRDGVSFKRIFNFLNLTSNPVKSKLDLINWMIFNLIVTNSDAHGKNISFFINKKGISLTPFYDIVNISIYAELENELAMAIGGEFDPHEIMAFQLIEFCNQCNLAPRLISNQLKNTLKDITSKLSLVELPQKAQNKDEQEFWNQLILIVEERIAHFTAVLPEILNLKF